jgi:hypothetical protein
MRSWRTLVLGTAVFLAALIQVPQILHLIDERYQGVLVHLNADEYVYQARVGEALNGRPEQASEAIIGDPSLIGSQFALLEAVYGIAFSWTGWRAVTVLQVMDSFVVFGVFLSLLWFFRQNNFSRRLSYAGALFFVLLQLNNLNRPIHLGGTFLLMLTTINLLIAGYRGKLWAGIVGGALLGILIGVYVWSWTFAWLWWGLFVVATFADHWMYGRNERLPWRLLVFTGVAVIAALPFLWQLYTLSQHPLYEEAVFRSGMHPSRLPESWPYSILFAGMTISVVSVAWRRFPIIRQHRAAALMIVTAIIAINQQAIHGTTFNFVSHYLTSLVLAGTCMLLLFAKTRSRLLIPGVLCAAVYLAAVGWDGRWVIKQFSVDAWDFEEQYLGSAFPTLDALPRQRILSDPGNSLFLAGSTKHDVVYTIYLKNVLIPHTEIAERHCLTLLPLPSEERQLEEEGLIYPDAVSAFRNDPSVRERETAMMREACDRIDRDPATYLEKYGVDAVFWDEKRKSTWDLSRLKVPLEKIGEGGVGERGWSLWKLEG